MQSLVESALLYRTGASQIQLRALRIIFDVGLCHPKGLLLRRLMLCLCLVIEGYML